MALEPNQALVEHARKRAESLRNRIDKQNEELLDLSRQIPELTKAVHAYAAARAQAAAPTAAHTSGDDARPAI